MEFASQALDFPEAPPDRPYFYGCMVLSFDGKMGFCDDPDGTLISKLNMADPKGAAEDFRILNLCRCYSDGVIIGTGTLKARNDRLWYAQIKDEGLREYRRTLDKKTETPLSLIVSYNGKDIPFDNPIFQMDPAPVILTSRMGADIVKEKLERRTRTITTPENLLSDDDILRIVAAGDEAVDTRELMKLLKDCGICHACVEAPGYIWQLIEESMLDEYFLDYSGVMAGGIMTLGDKMPFKSGLHPHAELVSIYNTKGFIFTRQRLLYK